MPRNNFKQFTKHFFRWPVFVLMILAFSVYFTKNYFRSHFCMVNLWIPGRSDLNCDQYETLRKFVFAAQTFKTFKTFNESKLQTRCPRVLFADEGKVRDWVKLSSPLPTQPNQADPCIFFSEMIPLLVDAGVDGWDNPTYFKVLSKKPFEVEFTSAGTDETLGTADDFKWKTSERYTTEDGFNGAMNPFDENPK